MMKCGVNRVTLVGNVGEVPRVSAYVLFAVVLKDYLRKITHISFHFIAIGFPGEPVAPLIGSGENMKANSYT